MKIILDKIILIACLVLNSGCSVQDVEEKEPTIITENIAEATETTTESIEIFSVAQESTTSEAQETTSVAAEIDYNDTDNTQNDQSDEETVHKGKMINVKPLSQYPELATGCEITSLTMALRYYGFDADKCDLSDNYLKKGPVGKVNFYEAFEGDPRDDSSYGCYAPVIKNTADKYLKSNGSPWSAKDLTGTELEDLFSYIDNNVPVIVWGTLDCREGHYSVTWTVDGEDLTWYTPEHCMLLVGYDEDCVTVCDPSHGDVRSYDRELFESRYNALKKQAVIINAQL